MIISFIAKLGFGINNMIRTKEGMVLVSGCTPIEYYPGFRPGFISLRAKGDGVISFLGVGASPQGSSTGLIKSIDVRIGTFPLEIVVIFNTGRWTSCSSIVLICATVSITGNGFASTPAANCDTSRILWPFQCGGTSRIEVNSTACDVTALVVCNLYREIETIDDGDIIVVQVLIARQRKFCKRGRRNAGSAMCIANETSNTTTIKTLGCGIGVFEVAGTAAPNATSGPIIWNGKGDLRVGICLPSGR